MPLLMKNPVPGEISPQKANYLRLYEEVFPKVARWISSMGGSLPDARDIFQDALVVYFEKSRDPEFEIQTSIDAYLMGISKHLWMKKYQLDATHVQLNDYESQLTVPDAFYESPDTGRLLNLLQTAGRKCMELLSAFYFEKRSVQHISSSFGYRNEHSVTVQKYKCIEKVRATVKSKTIEYEDFLA